MRGQRPRVLPAHPLGGDARGAPQTAGGGMRLIGVGVGPGDPEHLTLKALRALQGGRPRLRPRRRPRGGDRRRARRVSSRSTFAHDRRRARATSTGTARARGSPRSSTGTAAFATIGDPNLYSTFTYVAHAVRALRARTWSIETVPGITAMQDLAARSGTVLAEGDERLALIPYTAGDDALRDALAQLRHRDRLQGRPPPAGRAATRSTTPAATPSTARSSAAPGETLIAPDGAAPYFSTVIAPRGATAAGAACEQRATQEVVATVETPLHRAPAECKVLATILFVLAVALVPRGQLVWPYAVDAALLAVVAIAARIDPRDAGRAAGDRGAVRALRRRAAVRGRGRAVAGVRDRRQGDAGRARHRRAGLDDARARRSCAAPSGSALPRQLVAIAGFALRYLRSSPTSCGGCGSRASSAATTPRWLWQSAGRDEGHRRARRAHVRARRARARRDARARLRRPDAGAAARARRVAAGVGGRGARARASPSRSSSPRGWCEHRESPPRRCMVVGHGTRDADGLEEFWTLAEHVREAAGELPVGFGFIELAEPLVDAGIDELVARGSTRRGLASRSCCSPPGISRTTAPPRSRARASRHPRRRVPHGPRPRHRPGRARRSSRTGPARRWATHRRSAVVLVGRGSSDPDATSDLYKVARLLADNRGLGLVEPAFAGVAQPSVTEALERCRRLGATHIAVVPFFLFTGVLVPRIYAQAAEYAAAAPGADGRRGRAPRPGPAARAARARALPRGADRRRADELRPLHLPRAAARLRGQGRHADLAHAAWRRSRARLAPARARARTAGARDQPPARCGRRRAWRTRPDVLWRCASWPTPTRTARARWPASTCGSRAGERVALLGPERRGQDDARARPPAGRWRTSPARCRRRDDARARPAREIRRRAGIVFQDADDQLFMPTVEEDVAFGPANQGLRGDALRARVDEALDAVRAAASSPSRRRTR